MKKKKNPLKEFHYAWLRHVHRNPHHWQYWAQVSDDGEILTYKIPDKYILEMFCDWLGASKAQGHESGTVDEWYKINKNKLQLHPESRKKIEEILNKWKKSKN